MKKLLIALAAFAVMASCSKSDVEFTQSNEITFTPVAQNITKAMMNTTKFNTNEELNVWAFYNPTPTLTDNIDTWVSQYTVALNNGAKVYINNKTFAYDDEVKLWAGKENAYFWPKVGSLAFAGYHPTTATVTYTLTEDDNKMSFPDVNYTWVSNENTNTEDLMYFNLTKAYSQNNVIAVFKHALSWLTINVSTTESTINAGATIKVSSVKFTNVSPQGDGTVENQNTISWTTEGTAVTVETVNSAFDLTKDATKLKEPLFIPQSMAGNLEITYTIISEDNESFTETKIVTLSGMKDSNDNTLSAWEPAKHYTYNITISTEEILIDPSVTNWSDVTINVPIPETNN